VHGEIEIMSVKSLINKDKYQYLDSSLKHAQNYTHTCLMVLHINVQQSPGSHFVVADSGTSMHFLQCRMFTSNLSEDHTTVPGFSGNTRRATHRGDFNCVVRAQDARLIHLVDPSAALVIPDSHRNLYSVRHAKISGHTVILRAQAGLLPYGDPELFVPFLEDKSTGLWLLPLLPPPQTHNGVYPFYNTEPSSGHAQRNDYKDSDQGIVHGSKDDHFPWYLTTVSEQQLHVLQHQQLSIKIELIF